MIFVSQFDSWARLHPLIEYARSVDNAGEEDLDEELIERLLAGLVEGIELVTAGKFCSHVEGVCCADDHTPQLR